MADVELVLESFSSLLSYRLVYMTGKSVDYGERKFLPGGGLKSDQFPSCRYHVHRVNEVINWGYLKEKG